MSKKQFFLARWLKRLFRGNHKEMDALAEERLQTPLRTVIRNFREKKSAMFGLIMFIAIFLFVSIGPYIWKLDLSEQDNTMVNVAPSCSMLKLPKGLDGNVKDIGVGSTFAIGIDNDGHVYSWGYTRITDTIDIANIPDEVQEADLVSLAVGNDHAVALAEDGQLYVWGNTRLQQAKV